MAGDLKDRFPGFFRPDDAVFDALWHEGTLVPDASALLDLYRVAAPTRDALFEALNFFKGRLFVPHQFALEFMRNRAHVVAADARAFHETLKNLDALIQRSEEGRAPRLVPSALEHLRASRDELKQAADAQHALLSEDPILERLLDLIDESIGDTPDQKTVDGWSREGETRYENRQPPGYRDAHKDPPDRYGDFFAWKQVLAWAKANAKDVILVTSDAKEDWWRSAKGYTISPQPGLVAEFLQQSAKTFYAYRTHSFVSTAAKYTKIEGAEDAAKEIGTLKEWTEEPTVGTKKKTPAAEASEGGKAGRKRKMDKRGASDERDEVERTIDTSEGSAVVAATEPGED